MCETPEEQIETVVPARSKFQDSGLGSSLNTEEPGRSSIQNVARSVTSFRSFMSFEDSAASLPRLPPITSTGDRSCTICEHSIKDITNESQWR